MVRSVKVELEADTGRYVPPVEKAKESTEGFKRKVKETDDQLQKIPPDAAKAAAAMKLLGDESGKAGLKLDDLNKRTSMDEIDRRLVKTRGEVRALADEFNRTGSAGTLEKLFGKQGDLQGLEKLKGRLSSALSTGAADGGKEGAKAFSSAMQGGLSTPVLGPVIGTAIAGAVLAGTPMVNAALLSAFGGGGLALGIAGQLHDPTVRKAFADLGTDLKTELSDATTSFRVPLVNSAHLFGAELHQALASIDFAGLSKLLEPLAGGLGGMLSASMPGINQAIGAAQPILKELASMLPAIGRGISDMLAAFARGGPGAVEALRALTLLLIGLMRIVGFLVERVSAFFHNVVAVASDVAAALEKAFAPLKPVAHFFEMVKDMADKIRYGFSDGADVVGRSLKEVGGAAALTDEKLQALDSTIGKLKVTEDTLASHATQYLLDQMMSLDRAALSFDESMTRVSESVKQNGRTLDEHSSKGQANRDVIMGMIEANIAEYKAQIASGASAQDAGAKYEENAKQIEKTAVAAYGNTAAVHGMIDKYKDVPSKVATDLAMNGLTDAINNLDDLLRELNGLPPRKFIDIFLTEHRSEIVQHINQDMGHVQRWGGAYEHAREGLLSAKIYSPMGPARYAFAEPATGGEGFVPRFGDYRRSTAIIDQEARWYGGRFVPGGMGGGGATNIVNLTVHAGMGTDGYTVGRQIAEHLRPYVNSKGGNVQVALGR